MNRNPKQDQRVLAIDPGDTRLGTAISDPTATIATPLGFIEHTSREADAEEIVRLATDHQVIRIIIGHALDWDGKTTSQSQKAVRLASAVEKATTIPVTLWNEYGSTHKAKNALRMMGTSRKKRREPLDDLAAAIILQSYLDSVMRNEQE